MISSTSEVHSGSQVKTFILAKAVLVNIKSDRTNKIFSTSSPIINIDEHHGYLNCECIAT